MLYQRTIRQCLLFLAVVSLSFIEISTAFSCGSLAQRNHRRLHPPHETLSVHRLAAVSSASSDQEIMPPTTATNTNSVEMRTYEHQGWNLKYRYKPASPGYESEVPMLLVHPVGIGLSSWFWDRFLDAWEGPELYAPDLIGCGVENGSDPWDPDEKGLSFPLGWVEGCETLMQSIIASSDSSRQRLGQFPFFKNSSRSNSGKCVVVSQGGLAPVGVMLAARNPEVVSKLVLSCPPTWVDMTTPVPESELDRNYNFLRSPVFGPIAFGLLESRGAVEFFSNAILFEEKCDDQWLDLAKTGSVKDARSPVIAFNAGFCQHRSFQEELESLPQPTLVLSGTADSRSEKRQPYQTQMRDCVLQSLPGKNVLPWESPVQVCQAIRRFCLEEEEEAQ